MQVTTSAAAPSVDTMSEFEHGDPEIFAVLADELARQQNCIELIASENFVSAAVLSAQGSVLTNKYAEGYPGRRYYGGCEFVDVAERLAIERAKQLFACDFANVQPHSGSQANQGAMLALVKPGDTVLGMSLAAGGHLTHGAKPNLSGKWFNAVQYGVRQQDGRINYDDVARLAEEHRPKLIIAGGSAYPRIIDFACFRAIADSIDAYLMVDMAHFAGLVAGGVHPSPLPHAHVVTTTTHKTLRGPRGGMVLCNDEAIGKKINSALFPGLQGGPLMHVIAAKAIAFREALAPEFSEYARAVVANAAAMAERLQERGLRIVSGGTDTHLMLVDVGAQGLSGCDAEDALHAVDITCNKNLIPYDERPPMEASGIRLGSAAITTRGLVVGECVQVADWIADVLAAPADAGVADRVRGEVAECAAAHPIYEPGAVGGA